MAESLVLNFITKSASNSLMGISLVPNFAILVRQHFVGFYFRDVKRQKKRLNHGEKSADKRVFTISLSCCFIGPTRISKHRVNNVLMTYLQVCINFQLKVYCERFEPRSHFKSRLSLMVPENVVLNRIVVVDSG